VAFGEGLFQSFDDAVEADHGYDFEQSAEHDHIEGLLHIEFVGGVHRVDAVNVDVGARDGFVDAVAIVYQYAAAFDFRFKLVHRRLIEDDGDVVFVEYGRADAFVADDDGYVSRAAALFRSVGWHPRYFLILHQSRISQYLAHRQDALTPESCYDYFLFHDSSIFYLLSFIFLRVNKLTKLLTTNY